jgi:hypothetical protein
MLLASSTFAQNNYALGPIESSNLKNEVVVLGQHFMLDANTRCTVRSRVVSRQQCVSALSRDSYAAVEGDPTKLERAAAITVFPFSYVPGASTVMVGSRVTAALNQIGVIQFGGLAVNDTSLLVSGPIAVGNGDYVEVAGIQPVSAGVVLANALRFGVASIAETGAETTFETVEVVSSQSITGTGIQTLTGSGVQSITGTGIQSITGTGTQSITGTGTQSITGTGTQSITGTGTQSITGTGTQSITGTGTGAQ